MTVTLTYDPTLSRVQVHATGLAAADQATVERSTDQIRWVTVRGGTAVGVTGGVFDLDVSDYEFSPGVVNYYRVRGISTAPITFVNAGSASSGSSGSRTPGAPASIVAGDLLLCLASTRNSGTGTVDTPAGWTQVAASGNVALLGKTYDGSEAMPTITFTGGAANEDTLARIAAWRNAALTPAISPQAQLNGSAQNIAYPGLTVTADDLLAIVAAWKQDDVTSVATLAGMTEVAETSSTAGNDASQVWDYVVQTDATDIAAGSFVVTGGASAISRALVVAFEHAAFLNEQTSSITPTIDSVWLKNVARPFLNLTVELGGTDLTISRPARGGVFEVVGRSLPVTVSDVRRSRRYPLVFRTESTEDANDLELLFASGDILYLQAPPDDECPIPSGVFLRAGDLTISAPTPSDPVRYFETIMTEVAAPGPDVVGATVTWQTVLDNYATWSALIADKATWADVLTLVGDASEVIVP
jgi:hypothetical protein